jgi:hypothetical protein
VAHRKRAGRILVVGGPYRRLVHPAQLGTARRLGDLLDRSQQAAPDAAPAVSREHPQLGPRQTEVLAPVELDVGHAAHGPPGSPGAPGARAGHQQAVLFGTVVVERHGQPFHPLPTRLVGPALRVRRLDHGEPGVERGAVMGVYLFHLDDPLGAQRRTAPS